MSRTTVLEAIDREYSQGLVKLNSSLSDLSNFKMLHEYCRYFRSFER